MKQTLNKVRKQNLVAFKNYEIIYKDHEGFVSGITSGSERRNLFVIWRSVAKTCLEDVHHCETF